MEETRQIGYEIRTLDKLVGRRVRAIMRQNGLNEENPMKRWITLYLYHHREEVVYQKDLEIKLYIPRSTLAGLVKQMEKDGVVVRSSVEGDARLKQIKLTPNMIEKFRTSFQVIKNEVDDYAVRGIDSSRLEVFYEVLDQIKTNLGGETEE